MPRPSKIFLNPYEIEIKEGLDNGNIGEYDPTTITINLREQLSKQQAQSSIVHELTHHVLEPCTFLTTKQEEAICRIMERAIISLIKDNPKLIEWVQNDIDK